MKRSWWAALWLLPAAVLMGTGVAVCVGIFSRLEELALIGGTENLLEQVQLCALYAMAGGGMVMIGIGMLVLTLLHVIRRTARIQREAEALRRKNEAMEALQTRLQQLAHHQRLETIGTLTASIAHEFNNMLTPIMGYSMMALEKISPEETGLYDDILEIYNTSRRAKGIISRLNDLARKNTDTSFRTVSPDDLIRKNLDVVRPAKPEGVTVKLNLNCWDQRLKANEIQLSQMLMNLMLNAFQAMPDGGELRIQSTFDDQFVHIWITDTGCGIPRELQSRVFEPFFTTKEAGKGTGLGLAIAAQVVEDHRGTIRLESEAGAGTTFTISLPRS